MMFRKSLLSLCLAASAFLFGCGGGGGNAGGVGEVFGLNRRPPDEFLVLSRPPLELPPNFTLSPTADDNPRSRADASVRQVIFGDDTAAVQTQVERLRESTSPGELYLLQEANAIGSDDDIRRQVDLETAQLIEEDGNFISDLLGTEQEFGTALDPQEESQRLQEQQ